MPRGCRQMLLEHPLQMRLVGKPRLQRHLGDRPAQAQLRACMLDPLIEQVGMRGQSETPAEGTDQISPRQPHGSTDVIDARLANIDWTALSPASRHLQRLSAIFIRKHQTVASRKPRR